MKYDTRNGKGHHVQNWHKSIQKEIFFTLVELIETMPNHPLEWRFNDMFAMISMLL